MTQIYLTSEQLEVLCQAAEPVAICRPDGSVVGIASPTVSIRAPSECRFTPAEIAAAELEASGPGPFRTTREILDALPGLRRS